MHCVNLTEGNVVKRVNCLYRVSSRQQLHEDDIPMQRAECRAFIDKINDWCFNKEYLEPAVSGFKTPIEKRKVLQSLLEAAKAKQFEVLLVYMSDRIGRKEDETPAYVSALNDLGIEVWSVKEGQLKTTEHIDKLLNYIRFWQAEGESRKTGMRVKSAQETMVKLGKFVGGKAPFGYDLVYSGDISNRGRALKKLVINEEEAKIVKKIFDYAVNYGYGAYKIARVLNEEKIKSVNDTWKACTVMQMLKNPIYKGYITYNRRQRNIYGGNYEKTPEDKWILSSEKQQELVIVNEDVWNKARNLREERKNNINSSESDETKRNIIASRGELTLMGIIYCGCCKRRLTNASSYSYWTTALGENKKKVSGRYRCTNKANATMICSGKTYYYAKEIEPIIYMMVTEYLDGLKEADIYEEISAILKNEEEKAKRALDDVKKQIDSVEKDRATLELNIPAALRGELTLSADKLFEMISCKEDVICGLKKQMIEKTAEYEKVRNNTEIILKKEYKISNWSELFMRSTAEQKKLILREMIDRIDVLNNNIKIKFKITKIDYLQKLSLNTADHDLPKQGI